MKKITLMMALLVCTFFIGCQNTTEQAADENKGSNPGVPSDLPANTIRFKFDGVETTISGTTFTVGGGNTIMGKEMQGQYIQAHTAAALVNGTYDKNSNPKYSMFFAQGGVAYLSDQGTANLTFNVTVTATEVTGTFSGTLRKGTAPIEIIPVTDGIFRVTK